MCVDVVSVLSGSCVLFIVTAVMITCFAHKYIISCVSMKYFKEI